MPNDTPLSKGVTVADIIGTPIMPMCTLFSPLTKLVNGTRYYAAQQSPFFNLASTILL